MKPTTIFIVGPTSSGKSVVASYVAQRLGGEIISCDSMQVYKDMNVITQIPSKDILSSCVHHLIGIIPPEKEFSVAEFVKKAKKIIGEIVSRSFIPIVSGGTGLYVKSLIDGIFSSPPKDENIRKELTELAKEKGNRFLYERLEKVDPLAARKLHPNDLRRVVRALEVYEETGVPISKKQSEIKGLSKEYSLKIFGLKLPRELLYARINATIERMFDEGLVDEVRNLRARSLSLTAGKALGIKEVSSFLNGALKLDEAKELLKKNTRHFAKRQLTWFRADRRIVWIDADRDLEAVAGDIVRVLQGRFRK